jgi:hypothetical protein
MSAAQQELFPPTDMSLETRLKNQAVSIHKMMARISRLQDGLAFYADPDNWEPQYTPDDSPVLRDGGERARAALDGGQS